MSDQHPSHEHAAIHALPAHLYPFTIELFALTDPAGTHGAIHTVHVTDQGVATLPTRAELGRAAWMRMTFADGMVDEIWPDPHQPSDRTDMTDDIPEAHIADAHIADARRRIAAHGWMIQGVADIHDDTGAEDIMFTVGLTEAGLPELVWHAIPRGGPAARLAQTVLNDLARLSTGEELVCGRVYTVGLDDETRLTVVGLTVVERELAKPLGLAYAMYGRERVRYLVIEPVGENQA